MKLQRRKHKGPTKTIKKHKKAAKKTNSAIQKSTQAEATSTNTSASNSSSSSSSSTSTTRPTLQRPDFFSPRNRLSVPRLPVPELRTQLPPPIPLYSVTVSSPDSPVRTIRFRSPSTSPSLSPERTPPQRNVFCVKCSEKASADANYCWSCGAAIFRGPS